MNRESFGAIFLLFFGEVGGEGVGKKFPFRLPFSTFVHFSLRTAAVSSAETAPNLVSRPWPWWPNWWRMIAISRHHSFRLHLLADGIATLPVFLCRVAIGSNGFHLISRDWITFDRVARNFTGSVPGFSGFLRVEWVTNGFYLVLPSFEGFPLALPGFTEFWKHGFYEFFSIFWLGTWF